MRHKDVISMVGWLLLTAPLIGVTPQVANRGSIEGIVLRGETEDPAANIRVRLFLLQRAAATTGDPAVVTDHQGKFAFQDLEPGDYRLGFESDGYVRQVIPAQESLKVAAGRPPQSLTVRLTPTGTISGRVVDRSGQPIGNVPVRLMSETQSREVVTRSNDRGEYRFFFIPPGPHWVAAGEASELTVVRSNGAATRFDEEFDLTYFPGVTDRNSSRVLSVKPGEELSGVDIVMGNARMPSVRQLPIQGEVSPAGPTAPPPPPPHGQ
jgi:5-hydroxyisourate hydrolase-like protein (transthyretin family)